MKIKPKRRLKRKGKFFFSIFLVFVLLAVCFLVANAYLFQLPGVPTTLDALKPTPKSMTVLLLGADSRPGEVTGRTDSIIVAHVDTTQKRLSLLSVPRDTKVEIPRHGTDKINCANVYGGPALTADVVSDLIGTPVKYYTLVNWDGFKDIVDILGGITIDVDKRMYYYSRADGPEYAIDLRPGVQRLDGKKALQYVRCRNDALGDISRTQRQLKFLTALAHEVIKPETIIKLPRLIPKVNECMKTNLSTGQLIELASMAKKLDQLATVAQTLPGSFSNQNGVSYWAVDYEQARQVAKALFENGQVAKVIQDNAGDKSSGTTMVYQEKDNALPSPTAEQKNVQDENAQEQPGGTPENDWGDNGEIYPWPDDSTNPPDNESGLLSPDQQQDSAPENGQDNNGQNNSDENNDGSDSDGIEFIPIPDDSATGNI
ncbi:MAG TPA: transcriptional regulator [Desulfotomaculum sp.]|nr:MAG: Cell envelope-related transcriptional attenuator [Desulfotomaculum sp. 46_296]HAG11221.1 transcriptional regulator [Desulfotomaculum sp.]HBY03183.1 transcriptional regulator [Desulfotomaculum sp.]